MSQYRLVVFYEEFGGEDRDRTDDLVIANDALSQLSYFPAPGLDLAHAPAFVKSAA